MDSSIAKTFKTSRGFTYRYYYAPAQDGKPTLFFAHGFPSTAESWHRQATFFRSKGYGVLVPDMLGYGGTDAPSETEAYRMKLIVADIKELLDHENVEKIVAIGHDWGSVLVSRLANYHQNDSRFLGFGFLAVAYMQPDGNFDVDAINAATKQLLGYEVFGYWRFFVEQEANKVITEHPKSMASLAYAKDASLWATNFAPVGELKKWLLADRVVELDDWAKDEKTNHVKEKGVEGGLHWYKNVVFKISHADEKEIPEESHIIKKPTFFGGALKDAICLAAQGKETHAKYCPNTTLVDFDTGHWVQNALPEKTNEELLKWVESF